MSNVPQTSLSIVRKTTCTLILCLTLLYPAAASADLYVVLQEGHNDYATGRKTEPAPQTAPLVGLNDKGDLTIRYREATLTIAYAPDQTNPPQQPQILSMNQLESPAIPGISLALSIAF